MDIYEVLEKNKNARIIRNLCIMRTAIEQNFSKINEGLTIELKGLYSMPELIPQDALRQLDSDGASFCKKTSSKLCHHIIEINKLIRDRINNCKGIFPVWLNWEYIREMFNMKNGLTEEGALAAAGVYYENRGCYPYGVYINWEPRQDGNILYNDKKFVSLLYEWHDDCFADYSKTSDAGSFVKDNIRDFIDGAHKVVVVVDCENADPYHLCATLKRLDTALTAKIRKIILIDDVNTGDAWRFFRAQVQIPVEHIMTERVIKSKSVVDTYLTAVASREHYQDQVDRFVVVSSDSDYWGMICPLKDAKFLVMAKREKFSPDMKAALTRKGIFYCYTEDFCAEAGEDLKRCALLNEFSARLSSALKVNINDMFKEALAATRIEMEPTTRRQFLEKHIRPMKLVINECGDLSVELKV